MNLARLVVAELGRRKVRTALTLGSIVVAFFLFGLLGSVARAFTMGIDLSGADRLIMINKVSLIQPLPIAHLARIATAEGVADVTHSSWFGGTYQDPKNFFGKFPVVPDEYFAMYADLMEAPPEVFERWRATRNGAVVGRSLIDRFGWKVGDQVPIIPDIWPREGGGPWEFEIVGVYEGKAEGADTTQFLFRYDYFDEARSRGKGLVGWYMVRIADPERSAEIAANLDAMFANSSYETKTSTEKAFTQAFANQIGDIGFIVGGILVAVFFTILLVAGSTMAQSVRERTGEIGTLKALGFSDTAVLGLVLAEACLISVLGAVVGLALAVVAIPALAKGVENYLLLSQAPPTTLALGLLMALGLGLIAGGPPAVSAMRLRIADALRKAAQ